MYVNAMRALLKKLKPVFAWAVAVGILYFLFRQTPPRTIWQAFLQAHIGEFVVFAVLYFIIAYVADVITLYRILRMKHFPISLRTLCVLRARSYYYMVLNYNAGQGLLVYYLKKAGNTSWFKAGSTVIFIMLNDFFILLLAASLCFWTVTSRSLFFEVVHIVLLTSLSLLIGLLIVCKYLPRWIKPLGERMHLDKWYSYLYHYSGVDLLKTFAWRLGVVSIAIGGPYLAFLAFRIEVPFLYYLASMPIVHIVGSLPLTPSGLGTSQAAFLYLFKDHVTVPPTLYPDQSIASLLLALLIAWSFANFFLKFAVGIFFHVLDKRRSHRRAL